MNQSELKKFAQNTRRKLLRQIDNRLDYVLNHDDPYIRAHEKEKIKIKGLLGKKGKEQLVEETAYIWFNRLTALRFMDNRGYNRIRIVSPLEGESQPNILSEIKQGKFPEAISAVKQSVYDYIDGKIDTPDPDREAYKITLLAWCNYLGTAMPYLFEKIDDWAALLLPLDLLSEESIVTDIQKGIQKEDCKDVEVIGWLYQYYISEKKDEVFAGLKKNKKITKENIPAATQLFTPEWIVRYMVENSLGRLWLNNFPGSSLKGSMEYFVEGDKEKDILKVSDPVEIKVMDPSCGSGHILVYAFDILYKIYEEEGYTIADIPSLILKNNLFGVDIDDRAAALSAFALAMKARDKDRAFFEKGVVPNVIATQEVDVNSGDVKGIVFSEELKKSFDYLKDAKNLGSLIPVLSSITEEILDLHNRVKGVSSDDFFEKEKIEQFTAGLTQLGYLSPRYHCVITNPPYMGTKGMNLKLKDFVSKHYKDSKSDLFAVFMEKGLELCLTNGYMSMINQQSWMFLSSFERLREKVIKERTIITMAHLGAKAFDSIGGEVVQTTSFILKESHEDIHSNFLRLVNGKNEAQKELIFKNNIQNHDTDKSSLSSDYFFTVKPSEFSKIPRCPIAYNMPTVLLDIYARDNLIKNYVDAKSGQNTGDNNRFIKYWFEVSYSNIGFGLDKLENTDCNFPKWYPYNKGGEFRKWYGNFEYVVNWAYNGKEIKDYARERNNGGHWSRYIQNLDYMLREGITWTFISSSYFGARYTPLGHLFDYTGSSAFPIDGNLKKYIGYFCSGVAQFILKLMNPTISIQPGNVSTLPEPEFQPQVIKTLESDVNQLIELSRASWDSLERSWNFLKNQLINNNIKDRKISSIYNNLYLVWEDKIQQARNLERRNKKRFIEVFNLVDIVSNEISYSEITLDYNPYFRYGDNKSIEEMKALQLADTMKELISYAVGCSFGRYSLDKDGLILANVGEGFEYYLKQIPEPTFIPDKSGILPITNENDFTDDLPSQFKTFLKASFGQEHFQENLRFVEDAIGKDIRSYLIKDFYKDHVKRYKKRPIYWMISSPSGAFRALIYLHRYTKDTIGIFLNDYLRQYKKKLDAKIKLAEQTIISGSATSSDKTTAQKNIDKFHKVLKELDAWERDVVYPLALKRVELDLDDGVKVNYGKLGDVLEKVKGLNG